MGYPGSDSPRIERHGLKKLKRLRGCLPPGGIGFGPIPSALCCATLSSFAGCANCDCRLSLTFNPCVLTLIPGKVTKR